MRGAALFFRPADFAPDFRAGMFSCIDGGLTMFEPEAFSKRLQDIERRARVQGYPKGLLSISQAQLFLVPGKIVDAAFDLVREEWSWFLGLPDPSPKQTPIVPTGAVLPARNITVITEDFRGGPTAFNCQTERSSDTVVVTLVSDDGLFCLGTYIPGLPNIHLYDDSGIEEEMALAAVQGVSMTIALIGQPRFVVQQPALSRQQRRRHRSSGGGFAVDAWTRVSWNIGRDVVAKLSRDPGFHCQPLHFRRAHWRVAEPHYAGAVWLDERSAPRRPGWYTRIPESWPGHPAFGIKKSYHAPRLQMETAT